MKKKETTDRKDLLLRQMYESGQIGADEFLDRLFNTKEADRKRRKIVEKNEKSSKRLQEA